MSKNKNALKRAVMSGISFEEDEENQQEMLDTTSEQNLENEFNDDYEEQLKAQELFLKQQAKPSVQVKKSKFAMEREQRAQNDNTPKNVLRIFNNTNIVERDLSKSLITLPTLPSQPQPFPTLKQPTLTFLGRKKKQEENSQPREQKKQSQPIIEKPIVEKIEKPILPILHRVSEEESIDKESDKMLSEMSKEDIQDAQEQILKNFDPSLINLLKNRGLKKKQAKEKIPIINPKEMIPKEPAKLSKEQKKEIIEKDITEIIEKIKHSLNPNELQNVKEEEEKLKWIVGGQEVMAESEEEKKDNSKFKPLRFDLEGNIIDKNKEYHVQSGLYHHGGDQSEAGYTIMEIFQLIRSSVINQRIINIKLLASIIKKVDVNDSFELLEYLETKYELFKTIFWFGYADATNGSPTVIHKNLNLITVTSELIRTILSTLYSKQDGIYQIIGEGSFDFGLHTLNNSISEKVDVIKKYEKDVTQHIVADMVSILGCEDDNTLLECVSESLILLSRYSLTMASKISQEMLKKFAFKSFNSSLFYESPRLAMNYARLCSALAPHGKNICERIIKNTNIIDISKQFLTLCLSEQNEELLEFCDELVSFIVTCTSYKIVNVMHLFCQEMFPNLVTIIQLAFKNNYAMKLSKHCLFLMQVYMESKSALSFPSFEDKDEVDENSIGHLENFILEDCPLLAVKALKRGMDSLCIRFLYFICTFYDNFYCNPNSDFARFISKDDIDTTSQILMVMKRVENRVFYQEIYNWAESILNELENLENSPETFERITKLLANITSVVSICYFSSKSFKHLFGVLYNDIHFESLLLRIYSSVFTKYLFTKEFYTKSLTIENPLRYKYYVLRVRFFNLSFYFLKLYSYEKTKLKDLLTADQICNLALFSSSLLEPIKFKDDRNIFFYILQTFVLNYHPTLLNYLDKDLFEVSQSESEKENIIESNNIQVGVPLYSQEFEPTSSSDWIYKSIEYYYINRLDEIKNIGLIVDTLKFILSLTYGSNFRNVPQILEAPKSYINVFYPKVVQFANVMKVFLMDSDIFFIDSVQQLLQTWIDIYFEDQYSLQKDHAYPYATNPFQGFAKMETMEDIFFQMFKDFIEHQTSASFNQSTFAQYTLSFFVHTNVWSSKYRNHIVNELTLKQIRFLNIGEEWVDKLPVFPNETNLDLIILYLKRFLAVVSYEDLKSYFIFKYMAYHVYSCLPSLFAEWSIEHKSIISVLFESVTNEDVKIYLLNGLAEKNNLSSIEVLIERLKERKICC